MKKSTELNSFSSSELRQQQDKATFFELKTEILAMESELDEI
jgi:hypothetical protein